MRVVIAEPLAQHGQSVLRERGIEVVSCVGAARAQLLHSLEEADGLIVRSETHVDRDLLTRCSRLRVVGRAGVGVDAIDVDAATQAGIIVINTPSANTLAATEHTFALLLALMRRIVPANESVREGKWERTPFIGHELYGKALGIIGLGRIGGAICTRAIAFGMHVIAHDPYVPQARAQALQAQSESFEGVLANADILTLHVPLNAQTRNLIDAPALARMKPSAAIVNCSRGGVLDEEALLSALERDRLAGAALDVFAQEPPQRNSAAAELHRHPRVLATPHLGGSTHEALDRIAVELARDVADALHGRPAAGAVNAPAPSGANAALVRAFVEVADRLGRLIPQLFADALRAPLRMQLSGEIAQNDSEPLRAAFLSALLQATTDRRVSAVNARDVAREVGVTLEIVDEPVASAYAAVIAVSAGAHRFIATTLSGGARIVQLDAYELDAIPEGTWIVTRHEDVPGMVGRVGTILGQARVNISTMQVARDSSCGEALMILVVDRVLDRAHLQALRTIEGMRRVDVVAF